MTYDFLTGLYDDLMQLVRGLCVKRFDLASDAETLETSRAFDVYLACVSGKATYLTFYQYDYEAMIEAGFDKVTAESYAANPTNIPEENRARAVEYQSKYTIEHYEERNEYYRMLLGLPPLTEGTRYIYPTDEEGNYYEVKEDTTVFTAEEDTSIIGLPEDYDPGIDEIQLTRRIDYHTKKLKPDKDYTLDTAGRTATLTNPLPAGESLNIIVRRLDTPIPIHEYSVDQIGRLETFNILPKIKAAHPSAKYLNYLGSNAIDLLQARLARPFDLLRIGDPSNPRVIDLFQREYYFARRYVMANYYNRQAVVTKTLYDPTIGLLILSLAMRNIFALDEDSYLDFDEILNLIIESYGLLDYFKKFPFVYKRRLVLAMDALLETKGTDGVLVDVCKIFSPGQDLIADRYYLMKTQKRNPDGSVVESDDPEDMYNLTFLKARIDDRDIHTSEEYRVGYDTVTKPDYLWQIRKYKDDGVTITDEYRRMLEDPYNLRMTKYVDAQAAYDISSLTFEVCCFLNMLLEGRYKISNMILSNRYATGTNIKLKDTNVANGSSPLFTMIVFLLATLAQRAGYDGNIVYDPDTIAEVWGEQVDLKEIWHINYEDVTAEVKAIVDEYELQVDVDNLLLPELNDDLVVTNITVKPTEQSIVRNYVQNRILYDAIQTKMNETTDIRQYQGLKMIRDILFTRYVAEDAFEKSDGTLAKTYRDLLDDLDPRLGAKLDSIAGDEDEMNGVAVYILEQLQDFFRTDDLQYLFLNTPTVYISLISRYIEIAINVFKASSVQLRNINVIFKYGDNDPVRCFDQRCAHMHAYMDEEVHVKDTMSVNYKLTIEDYVTAGDKIYID